MRERIGQFIDWMGKWFEAHPRILALSLGLLTALGFEPFGLWPFALAGIGGFVALIAHARTNKSAFVLGWLFGWSQFAFSNSWMAHAFTFQSEMPVFLGWLAAPLLSLYLAIYPGLAAFLAFWITNKVAARRVKALGFVFVLSATWILTEWLRGWVLTGYPWNPLGIVFLGGYQQPGIASISAFTGTYALSGLAVMLAGLFWWLNEVRQRLPAITLLVALIVAMGTPSSPVERGTVNYTVVQPDVRQEVLNDPAYFEQNFAKAANLSIPDGQVEGNKRIVFWPESGLPDYIQNGYPPLYYQRFTAGGDPRVARRRIARVIGDNAVLLTGAIDLEFDGKQAIGARNAITAVDGKGDIIGSYYKSHLVPFGEYVPLRSVLEPIGVARFVPGVFDFLPGPGIRTLDFGDKGRVGMLICYEVIFSGQVIDPDNRPDFIFNPSNDGWYGAHGPPQHLAQARLRAIEEGLPVVRATTTGVSAVIDAYGVVRDYAPMNVAQRLDGKIPPPHEPTLFARLGHFLTLAWGLVFILAGLIAMRRGTKI